MLQYDYLMENYDHKSIEKKWQKEWQEKGIYKTSDDLSIPKKYILDMFPYPSGEGLHVGHPRGYIATDVYSRKSRMEGFNVLHPMGWDAFGLPAENFAIKNKVHPNVAVETNVKRFKEQLSLIGLDYDWNHEVSTTDPAFYKWTQWIFLKMFEKGLAYESNEPVNWCPTDKTVLANEDVEPDGTCERCGTKVEKRAMRQWVLKITDYADRLLEDLDKLPKWPEGVKEAQRNWIGKSEGSEIDFYVPNQNEHPIKVFTTRADTLFSVTFVAVSAGLAKDWLDIGWKANDEIQSYISQTLAEEVKRDFKEKEKTGIYAGFEVVNPATKELVPVWITNYVMKDVGTGAIMGVPAHDERDFEFAKKYNLPIIDKPFVDKFEITEKVGGKIVKKFRIKDWVFSRQRYWGEPIPVVHCEKCGVVGVPEKDLPVMLPEVDKYEPTGTGESPLADIEAWVNTTCPKCGGKARRETNTMPQWAGSSWYYLRFIDPKNDKALIDQNKEKHFMPVDVYVGGDHATRHLIYARFWHKFLFDIGIVSTEEPFPRLEFLGFILAEDGRKMSKRWKNVINPDDVISTFGADAFRLYEMFIAPFEGTVPWNTDGLVGTRRFIERVWRVKNIASGVSSENIIKILHKTIKKVAEDIESFKFNTAVSTLMIFINEVEKEKSISLEDYKTFLKLLSPFAPHITEELWHELGEKDSIHLQEWPKFDESKIVDEEITLAVQINGKVRAELVVSPNIEEAEIEKLALELPRIKDYVGTQNIKKVIIVKGRVINIVI